MHNVFVAVQFIFESSPDIYDMELMNRTIDFCRFLRDKRYEPILQIFYRIAREHTNFVTKCPVLKVICAPKLIRVKIKFRKSEFVEFICRK